MIFPFEDGIRYTPCRVFPSWPCRRGSGRVNRSSGRCGLRCRTPARTEGGAKDMRIFMQSCAHFPWKKIFIIWLLMALLWRIVNQHYSSSCDLMGLISWGLWATNEWAAWSQLRFGRSSDNHSVRGSKAPLLGLSRLFDNHLSCQRMNVGSIYGCQIFNKEPFGPANVCVWVRCLHVTSKRKVEDPFSKGPVAYPEPWPFKTSKR